MRGVGPDKDEQAGLKPRDRRHQLPEIALHIYIYIYMNIYTHIHTHSDMYVHTLGAF